ncbi:MAG: YraN family protein [Herpetosiphonaceae bacterium]|nr:YraN family protein [Herpetosiphonaceae bacterium]
MKDGRRATGAAGEQAAVIFLEARGYGILARNWRCARGELDIIAQDGRELVFIEVRTKRGTAYGSAEESITAVKRRRLVRLAGLYLDQLREAGTPWQGPWRIDVVGVQIDGRGQMAINHLPHALEGAYS